MVFGVQKPYFCIIKEPILQRKTGTFETRNNLHHFSIRLSLQK